MQKTAYSYRLKSMPRSLSIDNKVYNHARSQAENDA